MDFNVDKRNWVVAANEMVMMQIDLGISTNYQVESMAVGAAAKLRHRELIKVRTEFASRYAPRARTGC